MKGSILDDADMKILFISFSRIFYYGVAMLTITLN